MFIAVVIYAIYVNFLAVARSWVEHGVVPAGLGLWWVHGALLIVVLVLAVRQSGTRWMLLRLSGKAPSL